MVNHPQPAQVGLRWPALTRHAPWGLGGAVGITRSDEATGADVWQSVVGAASPGGRRRTCVVPRRESSSAVPTNRSNFAHWVWAGSRGSSLRSSPHRGTSPKELGAPVRILFVSRPLSATSMRDESNRHGEARRRRIALGSGVTSPKSRSRRVKSQSRWHGVVPECPPGPLIRRREPAGDTQRWRLRFRRKTSRSCEAPLPPITVTKSHPYRSRR